jgi:cell division protein YceG involved in septum cleavage
MPRKRVWISLGVFVALIGGATGLAALAWRELNAPLAIPSEGTLVEVANGASLRAVTAQLAERGILDHPWLLASYARATGDATQIKFG